MGSREELGNSNGGAGTHGESYAESKNEQTPEMNFTSCTPCSGEGL